MKLKELKENNARLSFEVTNLKLTIQANEKTILRLQSDFNKVEGILKKELCMNCKERLIGA